MGQVSLFSPYKERVGFTFAILVTVDSVRAMCVMLSKWTAIYEENKIENEWEILNGSLYMMG